MRYVWQGSPRNIAAKTRRAVCVMSLKWLTLDRNFLKTRFGW